MGGGGGGESLFTGVKPEKQREIKVAPKALPRS